MTYTVKISNHDYQAFMYRDLGKFDGLKKVDAAFSFNKRYKILDRSYERSNVILTFETEQMATWFLLNLPHS